MMRFISIAYLAIFYTRPAIVLLAGLSALVGVALGLSKNGQPPFDPFTSYADMLPGHIAENINAQEFKCNLVYTVYTAPQHNLRTCLFKSVNAPFASISVTFSGKVIEGTAFTLLQNTLQIGDLISLWGRPEIKLIGDTTYLSWPERCITAWAKTDKQHYNLRLPVGYVVFDCN